MGSCYFFPPQVAIYMSYSYSNLAALTPPSYKSGPSPNYMIFGVYIIFFASLLQLQCRNMYLFRLHTSYISVSDAASSLPPPPPAATIGPQVCEVILYKMNGRA